jgi:hypothetical protein
MVFGEGDDGATAVGGVLTAVEDAFSGEFADHQADGRGGHLEAFGQVVDTEGAFARKAKLLGQGEGNRMRSTTSLASTRPSPRSTRRSPPPWTY